MNLLGYLQKKFQQLNRSGDEVLLDCPECGDVGKYNLWFNTVKNKGYCYKCNCSFTPISLIRRLERCSLTVATSILHSYTDYYRVDPKDFKALLTKALTSYNAEQPDLPELPEAELPEGFVSADVECHPYILRRVGSVAEASFFGLGHCVTGFYANRAIIPVYINKRLVTFVARSMSKPCKLCGGSGCERCGKRFVPYLYPKGCKTGHVLFNYDNAKESDHIVLTEGAFDAMRVGPSGVAVLGSTLSSHQVSLLLATKATRLTLMFDPDKAGDKATTQSLGRLRDFYRRVSVVRLPDGKDPDDFSRDELWSRIDSAPAVGTLAYVKKRLAGLD